MKLRQHLLTALAACALSLLPASAQNRNTTQLFNVPIAAGTGEVCALGDYAYVAHGTAGIEVVKISGAGSPALVGTIRPYPGQANIDITDIEVRGTMLYVGNDVPNGGPTPHTGFFMYDLSTSPVNPALTGTLTWGAGALHHLAASTHNFCIDVAAGRTYAYIASAISNTLAVFDVTNPALPEFKDEFYPPLSSGIVPGTVHDVTVRNGICASAWSTGGFAIHDVSNIASSGIDWQLEEIISTTTLLNYTRAANCLTYHLALSEDGNFLITADGRAYIGCRTWDLRTITAPNVPLAYTAQYTSSAGSIPHNLQVEGQYAYVAHLLDGLRVLEVLPSGQFRDMALFDTRPTSAGTSYAGAWGVFVAGEKVLVSDTAQGLYAVDFRDTITVVLAEWKNSTRTLTVEATSTAAPSVAINVTGFGTMTYSSTTGKYRLVTTGVNSNPGTVTLNSDIGGSRASSVRRR